MALPAIGGLGAQRAACADCRSIVEAESGCDADATHRVYPLSDAAGRAALTRATWETRPRDAERRAYLQQLQNRWFAAAAATGLITAACMLLDEPLFGPYLPFLTGFLLLAAFALSLPKVGQRLTELKAPVRSPRGVHFAVVPPVAGLPGRIAVEGDGSTPPLVAFELRLGDGATTLRHAWCRDHLVLLDDGRTVRIPAGRVRLQAGPERWEELPRAEATSYLRAIEPDPGPPATEGSDTPFPFDGAFLLQARDGDEVRLESPLAAFEQREAGGDALRPVGTPRVTIVG